MKLGAQHGPRLSAATGSVGIDLGLRDFASLSDGHVVGPARHYRRLEAELAKTQRVRQKARVRALHARIKNSRKDQLHKLSTALVEEYGAIFIGNVNASALAKTRMAKSVLDAGWSALRTTLQYKCDYAGVWFDEVDEAYSTVTCSCCKRRTGPRGLEGLRIREWACSECGAYHHRDINSADNILAAGRRRLAVGILVLPAPGAAATGCGREEVKEKWFSAMFVNLPFRRNSSDQHHLRPHRLKEASDIYLLISSLYRDR